jgi:hypothetical protein
MVRSNEFGEIIRDDALITRRDAVRRTIDPSAITVVHCDPFTGQVLDPNGSMEPAKEPFPTFATFEDAKDYCREVVRRYPHLECHVVGPGLAPWRHRDENWIAGEVEARNIAFRWHRRLDVLMPILVGVGILTSGVGMLVFGWFLLRLWTG